MFVTHVNNKFVFVLLVLVATVIPDLDSNFSSWGRHLLFRPLQFFTKHRGIIHSFTFVVFVSVILAIIWPVSVLGFFVGYSTHLLIDSFTKEGIQPFWPLKIKSKGFIVSGGKIEEILFFGFIIIDFILFVMMFVF